MSGHAVLAVPVPELDDFVRAGTARHDRSFVSADPAFVHAHVTVLAPWLAEPTAADLAAVGAVVGAEPAFDLTLGEVGEFPDGVIRLLAEPAGPFVRLTAALAALFPATPPYEGRYEEVVPHLTLEHRATGASVASVTGALGDLLPVRSRAARVDLQWWDNDDCHLRRTWALG